MAVTNGKLPSSSLVKLSVPGYLLADAAASFERIKRILPWMTTTSAADGYRSFAQQETVFLARYRRVSAGIVGPYKDVRYYKSLRYARYTGAPAAVPGTSNHGIGRTADFSGLGGFKGARYRAFAQIAASHGWSNAEGASIGEAWHWTYNPANDRFKATARKPARLDNLQVGSKGRAVKLWQDFLCYKGYQIVADSDFGPATVKATAAYQRSRGLSGDGKVGVLSWSQAALGVKLGSTGPEVEIWQAICGWVHGNGIDGVFGAGTDQRTREIQRWLGVTPDGDVGPATISAYRKKA